MSLKILYEVKFGVIFTMNLYPYPRMLLVGKHTHSQSNHGAG